MLSQVRFSVAGWCARCFQKLLTSGTLRLVLISSNTARTSGDASRYSIGFTAPIVEFLFLLDLGARRLHHLRPFRNFRLDVGAQLVRRAVGHVNAEIGESLSRCGIVQRFMDRIVQ